MEPKGINLAPQTDKFGIDFLQQNRTQMHSEIQLPVDRGAGGSGRSPEIHRAVHTLVHSYAGVSGQAVLPHSVPLHPLHIYSVQSLKRTQVTLVT